MGTYMQQQQQGLHNSRCSAARVRAWVCVSNISEVALVQNLCCLSTGDVAVCVEFVRWAMHDGMHDSRCAEVGVIGSLVHPVSQLACTGPDAAGRAGSWWQGWWPAAM